MKQPGSIDNHHGSNTLRLFIAIACPTLSKVHDLLKELEIAALEPCSGIRVVAEKDLHITLKFLGSVPSSSVTDIAAVLDQLAAATRPFEITLAGTGIFKDAFWLGASPSDPLTELALTINERLAHYGFPPETRPFIPHLTLARLNQKARLERQTWIRQREGQAWGSLQVGELHIYKSETLPTGVDYSILRTSIFARGS